MAWTPVPKEHHPIFLAAVPQDPDVATMPMFGGLAITVNGNIAAGLFGRSVMLRVSDADAAKVLAMEGGGYFDPMGRGAKMAGKVMLPEETLHDKRALSSWLDKAVTLARSLPPKAKKKAGAKRAPAKKKALAKKKAPAKKTRPRR